MVYEFLLARTRGHENKEAYRIMKDAIYDFLREFELAMSLDAGSNIE